MQNSSTNTKKPNSLAYNKDYTPLPSGICLRNASFSKCENQLILYTLLIEYRTKSHDDLKICRKCI